jgi:hypothetical protein
LFVPSFILPLLLLVTFTFETLFLTLDLGENTHTHTNSGEGDSELLLIQEFDIDSHEETETGLDSGAPRIRRVARSKTKTAVPAQNQFAQARAVASAALAYGNTSQQVQKHTQQQPQLLQKQPSSSSSSSSDSAQPSSSGDFPNPLVSLADTPSHALPPLSKLCGAFIDSLMIRDVSSSATRAGQQVAGKTATVGGTAGPESDSESGSDSDSDSGSDSDTDSGFSTDSNGEFESDSSDANSSDEELDDISRHDGLLAGWIARDASSHSRSSSSPLASGSRRPSLLSEVIGQERARGQSQPVAASSKRKLDDGEDADMGEEGDTAKSPPRTRHRRGSPAQQQQPRSTGKSRKRRHES